MVGLSRRLRCAAPGCARLRAASWPRGDKVAVGPGDDKLTARPREVADALCRESPSLERSRRAYGPARWSARSRSPVLPFSAVRAS